MKRHGQRRSDLKKDMPPPPHFNPLTPDYGLLTGHTLHSPSSGYSYSDAELFRSERSVNPNIRYVPDENNRDEMREWQYGYRSPRDHRPHPHDEEIFDLASEVLSKHPDIDVSQIDLDVRDGIVILYGIVETRRMKRLVEDVIYGLPGVHDVQNQIEVSRPDPDRRRIARSIA